MYVNFFRKNKSFDYLATLELEAVLLGCHGLVDQKPK